MLTFTQMLNVFVHLNKCIWFSHKCCPKTCVISGEQMAPHRNLSYFFLSFGPKHCFHYRTASRKNYFFCFRVRLWIFSYYFCCQIAGMLTFRRNLNSFGKCHTLLLSFFQKSFEIACRFFREISVLFSKVSTQFTWHHSLIWQFHMTDKTFWYGLFFVAAPSKAKIQITIAI